MAGQYKIQVFFNIFLAVTTTPFITYNPLYMLGNPNLLIPNVEKCSSFILHRIEMLKWYFTNVSFASLSPKLSLWQGLSCLLSGVISSESKGELKRDGKYSPSLSADGRGIPKLVRNK